MKKIISLFVTLICSSTFAQVVSSVDFHILNEGMEEEYIKLEKIWREFHSQNIEDGKMIRWTMLKVNESNGGPKDTPSFVTVNTYNSIESFNSIWDNITPEKFTKLVRKRLKGKMSSRQIKEILNAKIKKGHRSYMISPLEGTAPAAKLKVGDNILLDAMSQTNDEYESYEKSFAKSVMQYNVDNGTLNLWGFTKIFNRNESAMKEPTHFTWRVPVNNKEFEWDNETLHDKFGNKFVYDKMWQLTSESRKVIGNANLEIVDIIE
jgi:hypothetical protein